MRTLIATAIATLAGFVATPSTANADVHFSFGVSSHRFVSGYADCGRPIYSQRVFSGYDRCGNPVYRVVRAPYRRAAACRSNYRQRGYYNRGYRHGYVSPRYNRGRHYAYRRGGCR